MFPALLLVPCLGRQVPLWIATRPQYGNVQVSALNLQRKLRPSGTSLLARARNQKLENFSHGRVSSIPPVTKHHVHGAGIFNNGAAESHLESRDSWPPLLVNAPEIICRHAIQDGIRR